MIRSSVAAFYSLFSCLFYRSGALYWDTFDILFLRLHIRSEFEKIVYGMSEILFATKIAFRRLDRCMPQ